MRFVGRQRELGELARLLEKKTSSLAVIWGRRRIGKTTLIREFLKGKKSWGFVGLPPTPQTTKQDQIDNFIGQMTRNIGMPKLNASEWGEVLWHLGNQSEREERLIIVLDEISWMGSKDPDFLGHLKNEWDRSFSRHPNLILILCGSVSGWIEKNILSSTGFLGRVSLKQELKELPLEDCNEFWANKNNRISGYEKLKILAVTGGIPKYLEEILPGVSAEANLKPLCFSPTGLLYREYEQIFSDLFNKKAPTFDKIVRILADGAKNLDEICKELKIDKSGNISSYMHELVVAGFVAEEVTWNIKNKRPSNLKIFRLRDNYLRFYLKFIVPNKLKIEQGAFSYRALDDLSNWESILGLQFENLVVNNLPKICRILGFDSFDIAGPFFQRKTKSHLGCQVDLLIQRNNTLYICEVKFRRGLVGYEVVGEAQQKAERLVYPKGYSIRTVLIHVNGVTKQVSESGEFDKIIDFSELLKK